MAVQLQILNVASSNDHYHSSRLRCCYSNTKSSPKVVLVAKFPIVRLREPHDIAVEARRYGSDAKDRRVSASFRLQTMNWGKTIAQLV